MNFFKKRMMPRSIVLMLSLILISLSSIGSSYQNVLGYQELRDGNVKLIFERGKKLQGVSNAVLNKARQLDLQIEREIVERRTQNSRTYKIAGKNGYITEIVSGEPQYYKDSEGNWSQIEYQVSSREKINKLATIKNLTGVKTVSAATTTSTFYPDADAESTSVDGYVQQDGGGTNWSTNYVNGSGNGSSDTSITASALSHFYASSGEYQLARAFVLFDTSSIPDNEVISSATLSVYVTTKWDEDNDASAYMNVFMSNPTTTTGLLAEDFNKYGSTKFSTDQDISSIGTGAYLDFTLNSSGISNIDQSGISKFMLREGHDIDNNAPAGGVDLSSGIIFSTAETTGTSQDPKLVVVHGDLELAKVRKSANESVSNSTVLQGDNHLAVYLEANKSYIITGTIFATSASVTPDINIAFDVPSGTTMDVGLNSASDAFRHAQLLESDNVASNELPITANVPVVIMINGTFKTTGTAGNAILKWSQSNSNSTATTVLEGSYLKVEEI